jgi:CRP-like cAMP-binding protein
MEHIGHGHGILLRQIEEVVSLTKEETTYLKNTFQVVCRKKEESLLHSGFVASSLYFIVKGLVRVYNQDETGRETTSHILGPGEFVTEFDSFINYKPAKENIQCLTDCSLLQVSKKQHNDLYTHIHGWTQFCQTVYEREIMKLKRRAHLLQNLSALERYKTILDSDPDKVLDTPVKHLASYLGMQPQSLSRIRKVIK